MKRQMKKLIVSAVALSLVIPALSAPKAEAAKKPSLVKKVSVKAGKTKKVTVKGVKTKQIKKTTWSVKSKKVVTLSKKKKNSVTIKGKKAGKTVLTAKIKVGKKTYKKTCKITVKKAGKVTVTKAPVATPTAPAKVTNTPGAKATATPTAAPIAVPTMRALDQGYKKAKAPEAKDPDTFPTTVPEAKIDPATATVYDEDFEDVETGTKSTACVNEDTPDPEGLKRWILRSFSDDNNTGKDYLEVVESSTLPTGNSAVGNKVLKCHREANSKSWQGAMLNLSKKLEGGATYRVSFTAYSEVSSLNFNEQVIPIEGGDESYSYMPTRITATRWKTTKGQWKDFDYEITVPDDMYFYGFYFQSDDGTTGDMYVDNMKIVKTAQPSKATDIPKLKDIYSDTFGVVAVGASANDLLGDTASKFLNEQYNGITPGNEMKPNAVMDSDKIDAVPLEDAKAQGLYIPEGYDKQADNSATYNVTETVDGKDTIVKKTGVVVPKLKFDTIDKILTECHAKGLKLRGHTLLWHEQTPTYFFQKGFSVVNNKSKNTSEENMDLRLEYFVKNVMEHILKKDLELAGGDKSKCVLYAYDVVNEYMHSGSPKGTFWNTIYGITDKEKNAGYMSSTGVTLRPKFVKEAFQWADEICKKYDRDDVKLMYNDFNTYLCPEDEVLLIDFINEDGKICDGLGMQSHLTVGNAAHSPDLYAQALECFRSNMPDMDIHITEIDAGYTSTADKVVTDQDQAAYYDQIMGALLQSKAKGTKISALVIWSLYDGVSWRASSVPCLFNGLYSPKSAFFAVANAKDAYKSK